MKDSCQALNITTHISTVLLRLPYWILVLRTVWQEFFIPSACGNCLPLHVVLQCEVPHSFPQPVNHILQLAPRNLECGHWYFDLLRLYSCVKSLAVIDTLHSLINSRERGESKTSSILSHDNHNICARLSAAVTAKSGRGLTYLIDVMRLVPALFSHLYWRLIPNSVDSAKDTCIYSANASHI